MTHASEREQIAALTAGLAATIIIWIFAAGYAPATLEGLGEYSPWLYGPLSTAAWAIFSAIAYLLIRRARDRESPRDVYANYRCRDLGISAAMEGSVCANRDEKNHLAAATAGFALTITAWVAALSVMPTDWLDSLSAAPAWRYCAGSVALWAALSMAMYSAFSTVDRRKLEGRASAPGRTP